MLLFIITLLALLATSLYLFFWYMFTYWSRHGVPFVPPTVPYGNLKDAGKVSHISECMQRFYQTLKGRGPVGGIYFYVEPVALLLDIAVIKQVLIKDFANFQSRGIYYNEVDDPLSAHLFALDGPVWKRLRGKLTPTFTSGKMRYMFATVVDVAAQFRQCIGEQLASGDAVLEMKELLARFTTDVIGTCAFGIECNSLSNPDAEFRRMGKKVFSEPRNQGAVAFLMLAFPRMARRLRMKEEPEDVSEFFMGIVRETVEYRERNGVHRNDFMDLLIEIKNEVTEDGSVSMSLEELAAQAYVFFLAGFETSSTAMSYAVYELSLNADIRERARKEVHAVLARFDGELTYEAVMAMPYIEQILNESLRKYPPLPELVRRSSQAYTIPNTDITLEPNSLLLVPVYAIHHDPDYWPNPDLFDPDRFTPEAVRSRPNETFLAFGHGPRNCIGLRFGMMQARVGLITLLRHFEFGPCDRSVVPLKFCKTCPILTPADGLYLEFRTL